MRISYWSSDVCSSDLPAVFRPRLFRAQFIELSRQCRKPRMVAREQAAVGQVAFDPRHFLFDRLDQAGRHVVIAPVLVAQLLAFGRRGWWGGAKVGRAV